MIACAAALALLAGLAGPAAAEGIAPAAGVPRSADHGPVGRDQAPLVVTMPDTQPALPSGMVEMDPSRAPSTGDADKLEPNIDGGGARIR